jgi:serine O-acetyltransferase
MRAGLSDRSRRHGLKRARWRRRLRNRCRRRGLCRADRGLEHELYRLCAPLLARTVAEIAHALAEVDIHPGAEIEKGFFIDHGTRVVIGETAVIGRNVRIYQAVTLGRSVSKSAEMANCAKAIRAIPSSRTTLSSTPPRLLGRITIGRGSSIGSNVWLTESVPPGSRITQTKTQANDGGHSI